MIEKTGTFQIRIKGTKGSLELKPDTYDVTEIQEILGTIEDLLYPTQKKDRPLVTYDLQEGSVRHVFRTGAQAIIAFSAIMSQIQQLQSIDFLELRSAKAFETIQRISYAKNYQIELSTSTLPDFHLDITPHTKYLRTEDTWVNAEFYFYGELTDAGGKNKANIHLDTKEYGSLTIETDKDVLAHSDTNILYKHFGIRATGQQNVETGEFDKQSLKFVDFIDYSPIYDDAYLDSLVKKASASWNGIDADRWLADIRGNYAG